MTDNIGRDQLRALAERRIRLEDEKDALVSDIAELNGEAKSLGYSPKVFNAAIKRARMTAEQREDADNFQIELDLYVTAIEGPSDE